MMTNKPSTKVTVTNIDEGHIQVTFNTKTILFPKEMFAELPKVGDEIFITLQKHEDFKKNNEHLSKAILNKIFSKTP